MLSKKFTVLELLDLALRVPEVGAVNFNILHTVLTQMILELGLDSLQPICYIEDEVAAQAAIRKGRMEDPNIRRRPKKPLTSIKELKDMRKSTDTSKDDIQTIITEKEEGIKTVITEKNDDDKTQKEAETSADIQEKISKETTSKPKEDLSVQVSTSESSESDDLEKKASAAQALKQLAMEDLLESDRTNVVQETWRATNINRRMEAAEKILLELSNLVDLLLDKVFDMETETQEESISKSKSIIQDLDQYLEQIRNFDEKCRMLESRIDKSNEYTTEEIERIEGLIKEMVEKDEKEASTAVQNLSTKCEKLESELAAYKTALEDIKKYVSDMLENKAKELKAQISKLQDLIIPKDDFMDLLSRVDNLDEIKVNREELSQLLEQGFVENLLAEQESLRSDVEELNDRFSSLNESLNNLTRRIDEEILVSIEESIADLNSTVETMKTKLDTLDADDINDSFARLEEQIDVIIKEIDDLKTTRERLEKEAKANSKNISDLYALLDQLEYKKVDKIKMYELLEMKADVEMVSNKVDRSEFVSTVRDINGNLERLSIIVKINEEEMDEGFRKTKHEISLKMYTEDFIVATEPIRNRIKAIIYEQKRIKEIALAQLFPDAPGVVKCFSCQRKANLSGPKYQLNDENSTQEKTFEKHSKKSLKKYQSNDENFTQEKTFEKESKKSLKFPPIDLDNLPIPSSDKPRIQDAALLPVLFASARPQIGLAHEKRRSEIDKELEEYFSSGKVRPIGGEHTKTWPQQRGLKYSTRKLPRGKRSEVLLEGIDKRLYRGAVNIDEELNSDHDTETDVRTSNKSSDYSTREGFVHVKGTIVELQSSSSTMPSYSTISIPKKEPMVCFRRGGETFRHNVAEHERTRKEYSTHPSKQQIHKPMWRLCQKIT